MSLERKGFLWSDGEMVPFADASTHVLSHALHYGTGVFEGLRAYKRADGTPAIFRLREHMERLHTSARLYKIPLEWSAADLSEGARRVVRENGLGDCYLRPLVFLGLGNLGVNPRECPTRAIIAAFPWGAYLGPEAVEKGVRATISSWTRLHHTMFPTQAKACGQYLNSLLATREAKEKGFEEAILLDRDGNLSEGAGENVFVVSGGAIRTPGLESSILPGITRQSVQRIRSMALRVAGRSRRSSPAATSSPPTRSSSRAPPPRSRRSARSTATPSAPASAAPSRSGSRASSSARSAGKRRSTGSG